MRHYFQDRAELSDVQELPNGRIVANVRVARGGNVQDYLGREMGKPEMAIVRVYRPEDEVFRVDSMQTFPHAIVTLDHPSGSADFKRDAVGWLGGEVMRDGEFVSVPMTVAARHAVDAVKGGKKETSTGYATDIVWETGTSPKGEAYDAKMTNIIVDHVAIVQNGRAGSDCRIGDWRVVNSDGFTPEKTESPMPDIALRGVVLDGFTVMTNDAGIEAIVRLQNDAAKVAETHAAALAAKDAKIDAQALEITGLKANVLTDAAIDSRVSARGDLIATARAIHPDVKTDGVPDADIRKAVVLAKLGDTAVKDRPTAYVDARFDILAEDAKANGTVVTALAGRPAAPLNDATAANTAYAASVSDLNDWRNKGVA